jgi:glyoxylase-like metal-dependent hydrolase (beta-lactamase superfamily II)
MRRTLLFCCLFLLLGGTGAVVAQEILEAARAGDLARVRAVVEADSSQVSVRSASAKTPLTFAAQEGHLEIVAYLVGVGADPNARNVRNETPLIYAASTGHAEVVEYLLAHGADPGIRTVDGDTALDLATMQESYRIVRLLEAAGAVLAPIPAPQVLRLADRIHQIAFAWGEAPTILACAGRDGWLLVDTGWQRTVPDLLTTLKSLDDREIVAIINTHQHADHCQGNIIAGRSTPVIAFSRLDELAAAGVIRAGAGPLAGRSGRSFDRYYTFDFGGEEIRLIPAAGAHTDADLIVHFTRSNVVDLGDLMILQSFPSVTEAVDEYLEILARVSDVFPEDARLVCGHGAGGAIRDVAPYRRTLVTARDLVTGWIDEGRSREEILKDPALADFAEFSTFIPVLGVGSWVGAIWNSHRTERKGSTP